jgi:predicted nucleic acid-binding protein
MSDVVLIDAGPLVALIDRSDDWHLRCRRTFEGLDAPLLTVWPALAEASHLLKQVERGQANLLRLFERGTIGLPVLDIDDLPRINELMQKYHDLPMDLADAALVRVAEREQINRVFTIDRKDFEIYRPARISRFRILP